MEKLEKQRKRFIIYSTTIAVIGIIILGILSNIINEFESMMMIFFIFIVLIILVIALLYNTMVKKPFKLEYVGKILTEYKSTIKYIYKPDGNFYKDLIKNHKLIPSASTFNFRDMIEDEIDGVNYKSIDLHATHTQSTGKTTTTVTDFKGKIYDINIKSNYCNYVLKEEKWKRIPKDFEFLDLESIEFNDKFNLYVSDRHEAHKIFTPSFIQNVIEVEKIYNNVMTVLHIEDHLYLLLYNNKDQFEDVKAYSDGIISEYEEQLEMLKKYLYVFDEK